MTEDARYQQARAKAAALRGFYANLFSFIAVNVLLFVIDLASGDGWWFYWVTLFWGIGLAFHAWRVVWTRPGVRRRVGGAQDAGVPGEGEGAVGRLRHRPLVVTASAVIPAR